MLRHVLSAFAGILLPVAAYGADPIVSAPAPGYSWTGFYIGGQGSVGFGRSNVDDNGLTGLDTTFDIDGWSAGGVVGAQWQWNSLVLGAEGEGNWSDIDGDSQVQPGNFISSDIDAFGSVSGKLGAAWDRTLVYGTGGIAFGDIATGQSVGGAAFSQSETYVGWTAGGGVDFAVTGHVIVGAQYRFYDFGEEGFVPPAPFTPRDQDSHLHTVSGHVTVKFP